MGQSVARRPAGKARRRRNGRHPALSAPHSRVPRWLRNGRRRPAPSKRKPSARSRRRIGRRFARFPAPRAGNRTGASLHDAAPSRIGKDGRRPSDQPGIIAEAPHLLHLQRRTHCARCIESSPWHRPRRPARAASTTCPPVAANAAALMPRQPRRGARKPRTAQYPGIARIRTAGACRHYHPRRIEPNPDTVSPSTSAHGPHA